MSTLQSYECRPNFAAHIVAEFKVFGGPHDGDALQTKKAGHPNVITVPAASDLPYAADTQSILLLEDRVLLLHARK